MIKLSYVDPDLIVFPCVFLNFSLFFSRILRKKPELMDDSIFNCKTVAHERQCCALETNVCSRVPGSPELFLQWQHYQPPRALKHRQRTDSIVAVPPRALVRPQELHLHRLGRRQRRIQTRGSRRSRPKVGRAQKQTQHELRQAQPISSILLRERNNAEGCRRTLRV